MSNTENTSNPFISIEIPFEKNSNNFYEEEQKQADKAMNEIRMGDIYTQDNYSRQQDYLDTFSHVESLSKEKAQIAEDYNGAMRAGVDTLQEYNVLKEMPVSPVYDFNRLEEYAPTTAKAYRSKFYDSVSMQDYLPELAEAENSYNKIFGSGFYNEKADNTAYDTLDAILAGVYEGSNEILRGFKSIGVSAGSKIMNSIHGITGLAYELIDPEQAKFLESFNLQNITDEQVAALGNWLANFWGDGDEKANLAYQEIIRTINKSLNDSYVAEDVLPEIDLTKNYAERLKKSGTVNEFIGNVAQIVPQVAVALGAGLATGGGAWAGGATAFLTNFGMTLDAYNQDPLANKERKELAAFLSATAQTPLEFIGLKGVFKAFKPKSSIGIAFKDWIMGSAVEGSTEYFQSYPEQIAQEFVRGKNLDEMDDVADILTILFSYSFQKDALYQGLVGMAGGGVFGSVGAIGTLKNERAKAKNLIDVTSNLEFAKKYPALFQSRMKEHIENGTIPENMFVQAVKIQGLFQSGEETGITKPEIDVFLEQAGIDKAAYEEALKTGGTVDLPTANIPLLLETEKGTALLNEISANKKNETTGTEEVLDNIEKSKQASGAEKLFAPEDEYLLDHEYNATDEEIAEYEMRNAEMQQKIKEQQAFMNNEEQDLLFTTANEIINVTKNTERPYNYSEAMNMATIIDATLENISKNSGFSKAGAYKRFAPHFLSRFATQEELDTTIQNIKTERGSVAANRFNPYAITNYRKGKAYKNELADLNKTPIEQISGVHAMIKAVGMPIRITKAVTDFSEQYNEARRRMPRLFSNTHGVPYDEWRDIAIREGYASDLDDWGYILELIANAPTRQEAIEEQKSELLRHEEKLQDLVESNIKNIENIDPEEVYRADEEFALQEEAMFDEIDDRAMQNEILDSDEYEALYQQQEAEAKLQGEIAEWENVITSLEKKPRNNILMLKQTPLAMKLVSADFKELHVAPHLFDGIFPNEKKNEKHNSHPNIDRDVLKKIPEALTDPIAVYRDNKNGDRFIFVTELTDKNGAYIIVPVDFEGKNRRANINLVLTSYAKDKNNKANFDWFIKNIKNIVYINRKKDKEFWQKNKHLLKQASANVNGVMYAGSNSLWDVSQSLKLNIYNESDLVKLKNQYPAFYQLAYHGTPHNFDKFTLDHIGSGEGAQAHGWGLYFAKDKEISENYRKHLATNIYLDDEVFYNGIKGKLEKSTGNSIADDALLVSHGDIDKAISDVQSDVDYGIPKAKEAITILQDIKNNNRLKSENKGQLFEVDIPENDVLLDEDKEYKEQSSKVKKLLKKVLSDKIFSEYLEDGQTLQEFAEQELMDFENGFTGGNIYDRIKDLLGSDKETSLLLNQHGIKGITYDGKQDRRCFVVFDDNAISVLEKYYQEQRGSASPRASFLPVYGAKGIIQFFQATDITTASHEIGHWMRFVLEESALLPNAAISRYEDWQTACEFVGARIGEKWTREQEEKFAEEFVNYLSKGKAPSNKLKRVFNNLKNLFVNIYKKIRGNVKVSKEMAEVFDRLLATENEIKLARQKTGTVEVNNPASRYELDTFVYMNEEQKERWETLKAKANEEAETAMHEKLTREYQQNKKVWESEGRKIANEDSDHKILAMIIEKGGVYLDPDTREQYKSSITNIAKKWRRTIFTDKKINSLDANYISELFGIEGMNSTGNLIAYIESMPTKKQIQKDYVAKKSADWENSWKAEEVVLTESVSELLGVEADSLAKAVGVSAVSGRALRKMVKDTLATWKVGSVEDIVESLIQASKENARLAKAYIKMKDKSEKNMKLALEYKEKQRIAVEQIRERYRLKEMRDKALKKVKRVIKANTDKAVIDRNYFNMYQALAYKFGLTDKAPEVETLSLREFFQNEENNDVLFEAPEWLLSLPERGKLNYKDLSVDKFQDVMRVLTYLQTRGRTITEYRTQFMKADLNLLAKDCVESMEENLKDKKVYDDVERQKSFVAKIRGITSKLLADIRGIPFVIEACDGYRKGVDKINGIHYKAILEPLYNAETEKIKKVKEVFDKLEAALTPMKNLSKDERTKRWAIPEVALSAEVKREWGELSWNKQRVYMVALNMGNSGNIEAMKKGYGWTDEDLQVITSYLSKEEWAMVQQIWDIIEGMSPELNKVYEELTGMPMKKVEAEQVETPYGIIRGGYFPIVYDSRLSDVAYQREIDDINRQTPSMFAGAKVKDGFTKTRKGGGKLAVKLSIDVLESHLLDTIHYTTHAIPVSNIRKLINHQYFKSNFVRKFGNDTYMAMDSWLKYIARPEKERLTGLESVAEAGRHLATIYAMGFNVSTAILSFASLPVSANEIGYKYVLSGMKFILQNRQEAYNTITKLSPYMANRPKDLQHEIKKNLEKYGPTSEPVFETSIMGKPVKIYMKDMESVAFKLMSFMDSVVAYSTWYGAYQKSMIETNGDMQRSVTYADRIVDTTQSSGSNINLTEVQRKMVYTRMLAMFMTYTLNFENRLINKLGEAQKDDYKISAKDYILWSLNEITLPVVLTILIRSILGSDELPDEPEEYLKQIGKEHLYYLVSGIPVVRNLPSVFDWNSSNLTGNSIFDKQMVNLMKSPQRAYKAAFEDGDMEAFIKSSIDAGSFITRIPAHRVWQYYNRCYDLLDRLSK